MREGRIKLKTTIKLLKNIQNEIRHYIYMHPYADDLYFNEMVAEAYLPDAIYELEKYKWHDIRKNPKDLPNKSGEYIVCIKYHTGEKEIGIGYYKKITGYWDGSIALMYDGNIIAWKEIEPFEEDEV